MIVEITLLFVLNLLKEANLIKKVQETHGLNSEGYIFTKEKAMGALASQYFPMLLIIRIMI